MNHAPLRAWLPAFLVAAVSWGSSFLFIHVALEGLTPSQVGFGRVLIGAIVLFGMLLVTRHRPQLSARDVGYIAVIAIGMSTVPFVLIPMAQQHITSILASLLNATVPLWTALFVAILIPHERASRAQVGGLLLGAVGIAVLLGAWNVDELPVLGAVLMLGATAFYGIGSTMSRMLLSRVHEGPTALSAVQVGASAVMLAPFALMGPAPQTGALALDSSILWAMLALGVLGTSFTYVLFWKVVKVAGATTAASVTYIVPIVATALGILVLREELLWYEPVGAVVVLVGVWLAQRKPAAAKVAPAPSVAGQVAAQESERDEQEHTGA